MVTNRPLDEASMKPRWPTALAILAILLGLFSLAALVAPLTARAVVPGPELAQNAAAVKPAATGEPEHRVFLPLVLAPGQPPPASPYAAALSQALADCAATALNQVCYGGGSVTLDGGAPLTTPGQVATLDGVSGLTLVSPDAAHWSIALLRLAADSPTPGLGLTLLAFGNVQIRNLTLFQAAAGNGDVAPALSFSSGPVPGEDPETGAIIVYNPNHEEPLFIRLNGADLTLASSAVVQAQPGVMTVTMAAGSALVNTAAGEGAVIEAHQVTVPLDGSGKAAGAPTTPTLTDEDLLEPLVRHDEGDLLEPLVPRRRPTLQEVLDRLVADFYSAHDRCMQGNSRQVYRVMYFARLLKLYKAVPDDLMSQIDSRARQCATFEIEFNSVITGTSSVVLADMHVQGQGMIVSYHMDGRLVQEADMPLTHRRYNIAFESPCDWEIVLFDGFLDLWDSSMRINHNRLDISTKLSPVVITEHTVYYCDGYSYEVPTSFAFWREMFRSLHASEQVDGGNAYLFTPAHWKYTGNRIVAEAIMSREAMFYDGISTGDTWIVMLHKPGG